jgi:hypothetical protein
MSGLHTTIALYLPNKLRKITEYVGECVTIVCREVWYRGQLAVTFLKRGQFEVMMYGGQFGVSGRVRVRMAYLEVMNLKRGHPESKFEVRSLEGQVVKLRTAGAWRSQGVTVILQEAKLRIRLCPVQSEMR